MIRDIQRASIGAVLLLLFSVIPAFAHAELVESDPAEGETIQTPYTLTATFTEELVERSNIVVTNAAGAEVARGEPDPDERTVMIVELPELPVGDYVANWTARTADGAAERGRINLTVVAPATSPPSTPTPSPTAEPTPTPSALATAAPQTPPPATTAPTAEPTASPAPAPTASPAPTPVDPSAGGGDAVVAVAIGAVAIGALALFLFARTRR